MALPEELQTVTLTGTYVNLDGTPTVGYLIFEPSPQILKAAESREFVVPKVIQVNLDETGLFSVLLPANDDPDVEPLHWTYKVTEAFGARRTYSIEIKVANGPAQNIYDLAPVALSNGTYYEQGDRGPAGPPAIMTSGKPAVTVGGDGDYALDPVSGVIYHKTLGTWDNGTTVGGATSAATPATLVRRDANGSAHLTGVQLDDALPATAANATRKDYVDAADATKVPLSSKDQASGYVGLDANSRATVAGDVTLNAKLYVTGAVTLASAPSAASDATRKDYVDALRRPLQSNAITAAYTLALGDERKVIFCNASAPINVTVPNNSVVAFPNGTVIDIWQGTSAGIVTLVPADGTVYLNATDGSLSTRTRNSVLRLTKLSTNSWLVSGDNNNVPAVAVAGAANNSSGNGGKLVKWDAGGRIQAFDPAAAQDVATKNYVDTASNGSNAPTPSTTMKRDANGRSQVVDPAVAADIATKNYVDTRTPTGVTAATPSTLMQRDAAGRSSVADPAVSTDIATKNYVDLHGNVLFLNATDPVPAGTPANTLIYRPNTLKTSTFYWGSGTAFPNSTALATGDTFSHTGLGCLMTYNGSGWRQEETPQVANAAARTAISTTYASALYSRFRVLQLDTGNTWEWGAAAAKWYAVPDYTFPVAAAHASVTQTGLVAGWQILALDVSDYDSHAAFTTGTTGTTTTSLFTVPTGQDGLYACEGSAAINAASGAQYNARIIKNNTTFVGSTGSSSANSTAGALSVNAGTGRHLLPLVAGDKIQIQGYTSASWSTFIAGDAASWLAVERVR